MNGILVWTVYWYERYTGMNGILVWTVYWYERYTCINGIPVRTVHYWKPYIYPCIILRKRSLKVLVFSLKLSGKHSAHTGTDATRAFLGGAESIICFFWWGWVRYILIYIFLLVLGNVYFLYSLSIYVTNSRVQTVQFTDLQESQKKSNKNYVRLLKWINFLKIQIV